MFYYKIALRQVHDTYTWESQSPVQLGARVKVDFRGRPRIGLVIEAVDQPAFKTLPVQSVLEDKFLSVTSLNLALKLSHTHFTPVAKVLALMIPEAFWLKANPVKMDTEYKLKTGLDINDLRHPTQKAFWEFLNLQNKMVWNSAIPENFKNTAKTFIKNGYLTPLSEKIITEHSLKLLPVEESQNFTLTPAQSGVLHKLLPYTGGTLLWGVTGSGKTEVYKHYFKALLDNQPSAQFLFLLPEIALTPQLITAFHNRFPSQVAVWHSALTANEKVQVWARVQSGDIKILIGTRSASLVPIPNLAAMVMDEEHEWTFKNEFSPRFWTHEVVEFLATTLNIPYIYGSATPKLRSYHLVETGQLQLLQLPDRVHQTALPSIEIIDLKQEVKRQNFSPVSDALESAIKKTFRAQQQVVLFLNKRGYAGASMCRYCGDAFECDHCDMPLKLHRRADQSWLICHVCGSMKHFPKQCPSCGKSDFNFKGWGTQQLEERLRELFPHTTLFRADKDSITGRYDFENLLTKFKQTPQSILLGTQMIAKGLDFSQVGLVGIVLADVGLHIPDHHAEERVYQLLEQVSGRAGRRHTQGEILVQTYQENLPLFDFLRRHDTFGFMAQKYAEHKQLKLPPLSTIIKVIIVDKSKATAFAQCKNLHTELTKKLQSDNLQDVIEVVWAPAFFPKLHDKYWFYVFLKSDDKSVLESFIYNFTWPKEVKIDVSPVSLI